MATHSSILVWEIPWTEEHGGLTVHGVEDFETTPPQPHTMLHFNRFKFPNMLP